MQPHMQHITGTHKRKQVNKNTASTTQRYQTPPWKLNYSSSINSITIHVRILHKISSLLYSLLAPVWMNEDDNTIPYNVQRRVPIIHFPSLKLNCLIYGEFYLPALINLKCLLIFIILQMHWLWMPLVNGGAKIPRWNSKFKIGRLVQL